MTFATRPRYASLRARYERPIDALVLFAAIATLPIVVAQARGDADLWVLVSDWLIWAFLSLIICSWSSSFKSASYTHVRIFSRS